MRDLSEEEVIEVLCKAYNVKREDIDKDVIKYFSNISNGRILYTIQNTPEGIPYEEILLERDNGVNMKDIAPKYGLTAKVLNRRLDEYCVITKGMDYKVRIQRLKRRKAEQNEL